MEKKTLKIGKKQMLSSIPINLIRQWCYCPRVVYYMELMNIDYHQPRWVQQGEDFHKMEEKLWSRRNLSRFNLKTGKTYYNLMLQSEQLGLHGIVDMAVETNEAVYAIEFKLSVNSKKKGDYLQLVAYAMLLERHFLKPSLVGFLVGKGQVLHTINIDESKRKSVMQVSHKIREALQSGLKPESSATVNQCCTCEYVNFCNDRF